MQIICTDASSNLEVCFRFKICHIIFIFCYTWQDSEEICL